MKKRIITMLLASTLLLCGCGNNNKAEEKPAEVEHQNTDRDESDEIDNNDYSETNESSSKKDMNESTVKATNIPESMVYSNNGISISTLSCDIPEIGNIEIPVGISNTSGKSLYISCYNTAVNNVMCEGIFEGNVNDGEFVTGTISITRDVLDALGITDIGSIDMLFWVYENQADGSGQKIFDTGIRHIKTSIGDKNQSDEYCTSELFSDEKMTVSRTGDSDISSSAFISVKNNTDIIMKYSPSTVRANGVDLSDDASIFADGRLVDADVFPGCTSLYIIMPTEEDIVNTGTPLTKYEFSLEFTTTEYEESYETGFLTIE